MDRNERGDRLLGRVGAATIGIVATGVFAYAVYGMTLVPAGDGSGFQWVALGPYTLLYAAVIAVARYAYVKNKTAD
jgi:hypothetical protein